MTVVATISMRPDTAAPLNLLPQSRVKLHKTRRFFEEEEKFREDSQRDLIYIRPLARSPCSFMINSIKPFRCCSIMFVNTFFYVSKQRLLFSHRSQREFVK